MKLRFRVWDSTKAIHAHRNEADVSAGIPKLEPGNKIKISPPCGVYFAGGRGLRDGSK
jgi:hypothetical protein